MYWITNSYIQNASVRDEVYNMQYLRSNIPIWNDEPNMMKKRTTVKSSDIMRLDFWCWRLFKRSTPFVENEISAHSVRHLPQRIERHKTKNGQKQNVCTFFLIRVAPWEQNHNFFFLHKQNHRICTCRMLYLLFSESVRCNSIDKNECPHKVMRCDKLIHFAGPLYSV